jgi:hypothetical protein
LVSSLYLKEFLFVAETQVFLRKRSLLTDGENPNEALRKTSSFEWKLTPAQAGYSTVAFFFAQEDKRSRSNCERFDDLYFVQNTDLSTLKVVCKQVLKISLSSRGTSQRHTFWDNNDFRIAYSFSPVQKK